MKPPSASSSPAVQRQSFQEKVGARMLERLAQKGLDAAVEYAFAVSGGHPHVREHLIAVAPEPLRSLVAAATQARHQQRIEAVRNQQAELVAHTKANAAAKAAPRAGLVGAYESAKRAGQVVSYLASMAPSERDLVATKDERVASIALRGNCIKSTEVRSLLGCSEAELSRWSTDGRLPVMYRRRRPTSFGSLEVRHWLRAAVTDAAAMVEVWRREDAERASQVRKAARSRRP